MLQDSYFYAHLIGEEVQASGVVEGYVISNEPSGLYLRPMLSDSGSSFSFIEICSLQHSMG